MPERKETAIKQEKRISKTLEQYEGGWPPTDAPGFFAWVKAKLNDVPEAFRSTVRIELDSRGRYESTYATIEFSYVRPETDEEEAQREQQSATQAERRRAQELRTLAELQAKYGTTGV